MRGSNIGKFVFSQQQKTSAKTFTELSGFASTKLQAINFEDCIGVCIATATTTTTTTTTTTKTTTIIITQNLRNFSFQMKLFVILPAMPVPAFVQ
jgi:hypothetical protein